MQHENQIVVERPLSEWPLFFKLNAEIKEIVAREQVLRDEIDKIIAEIEGGQTV